MFGIEEIEMEWNNIKDAPKDGTTVWLSWFEGADGPFNACKMHWDKDMTNGLFPDKIGGMWCDAIATWNDDGEGGPTHFAWCM